jgi:uncharacterized OsmC-like protein
MVASAMGIHTEKILVTVDGDLDLRGPLGLAKETLVGLENIRVPFEVAVPQATPDQLGALRRKTEQYCVVMQTLVQPKIKTEWSQQLFSNLSLAGTTPDV